MINVTVWREKIFRNVFVYFGWGMQKLSPVTSQKFICSVFVDDNEFFFNVIVIFL